MAEEVQRYVPGYRLKNDVVFDGRRVSIFLEIKGRGDFLPEYAGNLDIMTAAATRTAEIWAASESERASGIMSLRGRSVTLHDMCLRDGMHAKAHQLTTEQMMAIATGLDEAGVPLIEVTHGDGLGGGSVNYGFPAAFGRGIPASRGSADEACAGLRAAHPGHRHDRRPADGGGCGSKSGPRRHPLHRSRHRRAAPRRSRASSASTPSAS